ncbi:MAG: cysteine desulfurase [Bacilli bacterium]|nr:cysteine desulfurase [Bacilli bacterium]
MIYFDNASSTKPSKEVLEAYLNAAENYYENPNSIHKLGMKNLNEINRIRGRILKALNLSQDYEVVFTSGATESNNLGIIGYYNKNKNRGNHIITTKIEHDSVLNVFKHLEEIGAQVTYLDVNDQGEIDIEEFKKVINKNTILVSIMPVNNELGFVLNIDEISKIVRTFPKCVLHCDCVQTLGKYPFDYNLADMITISGHKINGLKGSGVLIKKKRIGLEPLVYGGGQENGLRSGTMDYPGILALCVAIENTVKNFPINYKKVGDLRGYLVENLKNCEEIKLNLFKKQCPFVLNITLKTKKASVVVEALSNEDILVSSVSACNSRREAPSHVLLALRRPEEEAYNSIRLSFNKNNTLDEAKTFVDVFTRVISSIKGRTL